jgi:hypothetical protein
MTPTRLCCTGLVLAALLCLAGVLEQSASVARAQAEAKKIKVGPNVYLEIEGKQRRVLVEGHICLRQGQLEQFLTRKRTKEHEAIVVADVDARDIALALIAAGAEKGQPVKFRPEFQPPTGTPIKVFVRYREGDKSVRVPAQQWIRNVASKKNLDSDWVFAGSRLIPDPEDHTKPPFFAANDGDVICLSNFETALLDVPFNSTKDNQDLVFEAHTERVPPLMTPVTVILEPAPTKKSE